ncbi:LIM domain protein [Opisthorchis viverrini]|nr:LIM domain protein [Opisthorchis viverrini]
MKERKFRLEAAQQLPFAKYPDEQVRSILDTSPTKTEPTVGDNSLYTWQTKDDTTKTNTQGALPGGPEEGDTQMANELSEVSNEPDEDETQDEDENEENEEYEGDERRIDVVLEVTRKTDTTNTVSEHVQNDENLASENQVDSTTAVTKSSNMAPEEFLSVMETVSKLNDDLGLTMPRRQFDEESLPFIDIGQEPDALDLAPLATYVEVPIQAKATPQNSPVRREMASLRRLTTNNVDEQMRRGRGDRSSPKAIRLQISPSDPVKLTHKQRELTITTEKVPNTPEETIPTPQAAVSLFESAAYNGHQTFGAFLCNVCGQTAYPAERCEADGQVFHVACFRCHQCSTMLQRGAWNQRGSHYFCNPCHRRIALQTLRH